MPRVADVDDTAQECACGDDDPVPFSSGVFLRQLWFVFLVAALTRLPVFLLLFLFLFLFFVFQEANGLSC